METTIDWSTQRLDVCMVALDAAHAHANKTALYADTTLHAYLRAEALDPKRVAVWREKLTYEESREFRREAARVQREDKARSLNGPHGPDAPQSEPASDRLPLVYAHEIGADSLHLLQIFEDVLTAGGLSVMYGAANSGKSYIGLYEACSIARGVNCLAKRTTPGLALYVAGEGAASVKMRIEAYKRHHSIDRFPLAIIPAAVNMLDPLADTQRVIDAARRAEDEFGLPITLTTIDTLARAFGGVNENSGEDMGAVIGNADRIRAETGTHLQFIHHSGKDESKGSRGHSSLRAATDTEIEVTDNGNRLHTCEIEAHQFMEAAGISKSSRYAAIHGLLLVERLIEDTVLGLRAKA